MISDIRTQNLAAELDTYPDLADKIPDLVQPDASVKEKTLAYEKWARQKWMASRYFYSGKIFFLENKLVYSSKVIFHGVNYTENLAPKIKTLVVGEVNEAETGLKWSSADFDITAKTFESMLAPAITIDEFEAHEFIVRLLPHTAVQMVMGDTQNLSNINPQNTVFFGVT